MEFDSWMVCTLHAVDMCTVVVCLDLLYCRVLPLYVIKSLWPSNAKGWHRSWLTLVELMACCLTITHPNHYWLIVNNTRSNLSKSNCTGTVLDMIYYETFENGIFRDDVITWKHFPRYWPFVWGIHRWIPSTKASDAELWCLLWSAPE